MKTFVIKVLLILFLCPLTIQLSQAQYITPYKKQINFILDDVIGKKSNFNFRFHDYINNDYEVDFTTTDSLNWKITLKRDSIIRKYEHRFNTIHQIGIVKPGKQTCVLVVSATGGNGIIKNEFTFINPEYDSIMNVQINHIVKNNNVTYDYNSVTLDPERSNEIKFIIGLVGEYDLIWYERYKEKL